MHREAQSTWVALYDMRSTKVSIIDVIEYTLSNMITECFTRYLVQGPDTFIRGHQNISVKTIRVLQTSP